MFRAINVLCPIYCLPFSCSFFFTSPKRKGTDKGRERRRSPCVRTLFLSPLWCALCKASFSSLFFCCCTDSSWRTTQKACSSYTVTYNFKVEPPVLRTKSEPHRPGLWHLETSVHKSSLGWGSCESQMSEFPLWRSWASVKIAFCLRRHQWLSWVQ